jgi:hypothetical protein
METLMKTVEQFDEHCRKTDDNVREIDDNH